MLSISTTRKIVLAAPWSQLRRRCRHLPPVRPKGRNALQRPFRTRGRSGELLSRHNASAAGCAPLVNPLHGRRNGDNRSCDVRRGEPISSIKIEARKHVRDAARAVWAVHHPQVVLEYLQGFRRRRPSTRSVLVPVPQRPMHQRLDLACGQSFLTSFLTPRVKSSSLSSRTRRGRCRIPQKPLDLLCFFFP